LWWYRAERANRQRDFTVEPKKIAPPLRSSHSDESRCSGSWKSHAMELETVWGVKNLTVLSGLG